MMPVCIQEKIGKFYDCVEGLSASEKRKLCKGLMQLIESSLTVGVIVYFCSFCFSLIRSVEM